MPEFFSFPLSYFLMGFALGCLIFLIALKWTKNQRRKTLRKEMNKTLSLAKTQAHRIEKNASLRARDFERKMRYKTEQSVGKERKRIEDMKYQMESKKNQMESLFKRKEEDMQIQLKELEQQKEHVQTVQSQAKKMSERYENRLKELNHLMENTAGLSREEALKEMKHQLEEEVKVGLGKEIREMEKKLKTESEKRTRLILAQAMSRLASEVSTERTTTSLPIKMEKTKGKIIGREGRNIRSLESACGVDIIIDESQEVIVISCFDPIRREVAFRAINRLLEEGRVHPARIEEVVSRIKRNLFVSMAETGKKTCFDLGLHGIKPSLMETLGSLQYRSLDGQNVLGASKEVAWLAGLIAVEMGFDVKMAKRAGLFHAIGLGVHHHVEGSYATVGAEILKKQGESEEVCQAVKNHNGSEAQSVLDHIVSAAYNLFRERPGAKREVMETYIRRLKDMESVANSFDGVVRSFALRTGKEIRVLVDSGKVSDEQAFMLSRDVAVKIKKEMEGTEGMTVSVVREFRMVEQAR